MAGLLSAGSLFIQMAILNRLTMLGITGNLPLVLILVWGQVFGSPLSSISAAQLRKSSLSEVFTRQLMSGSPSAFLVGLFMTCLYSHFVPCVPIAFPLMGWVAGYFCMRSLSQGNLLCIPVTFILTIFAELMMAAQLTVLGRPSALEHFSTVVLPEALLNSVIAPFIYFPLRRWYDFAEGQRSLAME